MAVGWLLLGSPWVSVGSTSSWGFAELVEWPCLTLHFANALSYVRFCMAPIFDGVPDLLWHLDDRSPAPALHVHGITQVHGRQVADLLSVLLPPSVLPRVWVPLLRQACDVHSYGFTLGNLLLDFRDHWQFAFLVWLVVYMNTVASYVAGVSSRVSSSSSLRSAV